MLGKRHTARKAISQPFIEEVCARLAENQRVRRTLPEGGRLHIDRQLPFLCVYRRPADRPDPGTQRLVNGEPSFLIAPGAAQLRKSVASLVRGIVETLRARFDAFLILEVWSVPDATPPKTAPDGAAAGTAEPAAAAAGTEAVGIPEELQPAFQVATGGLDPPRATVEALVKALRRIKVHRRSAEVETRAEAHPQPGRMARLLSPAEVRRLGCHVLGLEVRPIYRDAESGEIFPATLRVLRRGLSRALKQAFFRFALTHTAVRPQHYYALGRRAMVKAVWQADRRLAEISESFDFLLQATPIDAEAAWRQFKRAAFQAPPVFHYRPLPLEPAELKRRLYAIPIERIEDPTLAHLFRERQDELDRKITMLCDVGTARFVLGSLQVYGGTDPRLLSLANELLAAFPARSRDGAGGRQLDAHAFAERARTEIDCYRRVHPEFQATVTVRDDMYGGLLVSGGHLLIGRQTAVPAGRVEALLQHEVGTHLLTYYNGRAQPFRQLCTGLAGHDAMQEGLAVLSEYLVGGLSPQRMRLLAARVLAVDRLLDGAAFVDTFRLLWRSYGFSQRTAYTIVMRVYRGAGLTKDAVYLRGLLEILDYLRNGGQLEALLVGKIAADHVPLVTELRLREILRAPPLRPRYLDSPGAADKLRSLREGLSVQQLVEGRRK